jgi:hypothetical protein
MGGKNNHNRRIVVTLIITGAIVVACSSQLQFLTAIHRYSAVGIDREETSAVSPSVNELTLRKRSSDDGGHDDSTTIPSPVLPTSSSLNQTKSYYLLYFANSGFANQLLCLQHASLLAQMLNRVLLLPPILPHFGPGRTFAHMVLSSDGTRFESPRTYRAEPILNPFHHYLQRLPVDQYLPMDQVMDVEYSLPGIETMDVRTFYKGEQFHTTAMEQSSIEVDHGYSHLNTIWINKNQSDLLGRTEQIEVTEYGKFKVLNQTYRDVVNLLMPPSEDVLVFLDAFLVNFHEAIQVASRPWWRPRLARNIRTAVLHAHTTRGVGAEAGRLLPPYYYAAIHVRAGDGYFKNPQVLEQTIRHTLGDVAMVLSQWLSSGPLSTTASNASTTVGGVTSTSQTEKLHDAIGLYVATDLHDFRNHPVFRAESVQILESLYDRHGVNITIFSQQDVGNATQILNGILYADVFLDMQLAICASIGFVGTSGSTFSDMIHQHRQSEQECLLSEPIVPPHRG